MSPLRRALAAGVATAALLAAPALAAPTADFTMTPSNPIEGDTVEFQSTATDPL